MSENSAAPGPPPLPHAHHLRVERTARYYTLGPEDGGAAISAIWFVLHGHGQLAGAFVRFFSDIAAQGALVVAPEALNRFYLVSPDSAPARERPVGATWMTREDRESEISDYVEYLDALYDEIATVRTAPPPVTVLGFSQGAATATRWVLNGRAPIERLVLWGGTTPPEIDHAHNARLRRIGVTLVAGVRDHYITEEILAAERTRLESAGINPEVVQFDGGHAISRSVFPRLLSINGASDR